MAVEVWIFIPKPEEGAPMLVFCGEKGCSASWQIADEQVAAAKERGEIVVRITPQAGYSTLETVGICPACQAKYKQASRAARSAPKKRDADAEHRQLMQLVARTREVHPTWSTKRCVRAAVDFVNSASEEKDPAFRAYLLELEDH